MVASIVLLEWSSTIEAPFILYFLVASAWAIAIALLSPPEVLRDGALIIGASSTHADYPNQQILNAIVGGGILVLAIITCVSPHNWLIAVIAVLALVFGVAFVTSSSFGFFWALGHHKGLRSLGLVMALGTQGLARSFRARTLHGSTTIRRRKT